MGKFIVRRLLQGVIVVVAAASRLTANWALIGARILGSWIAASALLVLALRFVR